MFLQKLMPFSVRALSVKRQMFGDQTYIVLWPPYYEIIICDHPD